jgi:hypothetical protein
MVAAKVGSAKNKEMKKPRCKPCWICYLNFVTCLPLPCNWPNRNTKGLAVYRAFVVNLIVLALYHSSTADAE